MKRILAGISIGALIGFSSFCLATEVPTVKIGVIESADPAFYVNCFGPTMEYLRKQFPSIKIESQEISSEENPDAFTSFHPDFIISPSGWFSLYERTGGLRQISTLKGKTSPSAEQTSGSALVVLSSRRDLNTLKDLKGKRFIARDPGALDGWLAAKGELIQAGIPKSTIEHNVRFTEYNLPDVLSYLEANEADAAVLPVCNLEEAEEAGLVEKGQFKILSPKVTIGECVSSTPLYPGVVFASMPGTSSELVKDVTLKILSMPPMEDGSQWSIGGDFRPVHNLFRDLELGPFKPVPITLSWLWNSYQKEMFLGAILLACLLLHIFRTNFLVLERTAELRQAIAQRDKMAESARLASHRLNRLERKGLVAELCAIFAHELKQPLSVASNFSNGLKIYLQKLEKKDPTIESGISFIAEETERAVGIVNRVRQYAKGAEISHVNNDLEAIVKSAVTSFQTCFKPKAEISLKTENVGDVLCDAMEIELLTVNLLKNAAEAADASRKGKIKCELKRDARGVALTVEDNGPPLSKEALERIRSSLPGGSSKSEGLGIGLSIVKAIAERHHAVLSFDPVKPHGLKATIRFKEKTHG